MMNQTIAVLTLTALVNLTLGGCSKVVNMRLDEVAVDTPKRIIGVVGKAGDEVTFDQKGGNYEPAERLISGTSRYGEKVLKPLRTLDSVRLASPVDKGQAPVTVEAARFHGYSKRPGLDKIVAVVTTDSVTHRFWNSCRIDTLNGMFMGPFETSAQLHLPFDSVAYVKAIVPDRTGSAILGAVCAAVIGVSVFCAIVGIKRSLHDGTFD